MDIGSRAQARASDCQKLYELLVEASGWLQEKGLRQWNPAYPLHRFAREVEAGRVWYWAVGGEPVATATLDEHRPEYYPSGVWADAIRAWYICRFTVARRLAGQRVGEQVLEGIEAEAASAGILALRPDVAAANPFLEGYYLARGFQRHKTVEIFGEPSVLLAKAVGAK